MNSRGFNLLEVMVAMTVLGIGLIGTAPLLSWAIQRGAVARSQTHAQQLASELLEGLRTELRFDAEGRSPGSAGFGDGWRARVLPHEVKEPGAPAAGCVNGICCQLPGKDDGVRYHYGPLAFTREGWPFYACYALKRAATADPRGKGRRGMPDGSAEAHVKVLWRDARNGWSSLTLGDLLLAGN